MNKVTILVGLELVFGPILKDEQLEDGSFSSGSEIVDNDLVIAELDRKTNELWCSLFSKDEESHSGFSFDYEKEKEIAPVLLDYIDQIKSRLNEINDGSFEVEDMISEHLRSLASSC